MNMATGPQAHIEGFAEYVETRRAEIDNALARALPREPICPALVAEAMRYAVSSGGKRLRPILTLASAEAVVRAGGHWSDAALAEARRLAMPAACAIEFIHSYSLVHDDLPAMDNDSMRRGRPTLHVVYGEGMAILAGDGLLAEAFALLANEPCEVTHPHLAERKLSALRCVGRAVGAAGMLGGQAIDLELTGCVARPHHPRLTLDAELLRDMHARKTGALMRAAATAGAILAGGSAQQIDGVDHFAAELGLAFQIVDDILDVQSTSVALGKTAGKDVASGKLTYPSMHGLDRSRQFAADSVERAHRALLDAGLPDDCLMPIARWAVERSG